jgi:hypothetical protein
MAIMKKAQAGAKVKKVAKKVIKDDGNGANDYKNLVDKATGKKGTLGGEGNNPGPNYNMLKKNGGKVKKAQNGGATYSNLKIKNATAKDSVDYKKGYDAVKANKRVWFPNRATSEGIDEAKGRTRNKAKSGAALKKQAATAIAMKKAGKTPKSMMKAGGKMTKCKYGCN